MDDLIVAGSHGFDIWSPGGGAIERQVAGGFEELLARRDGAAARRTRLDRRRPRRAQAQLGRGPLPARRRARAAARGRRSSTRRWPSTPTTLKVTPGQDGVRDAAEDRLGQGQGGAAPAGARSGSTATTSCRSTSVTTSPTSTRSRRSPSAASGILVADSGRPGGPRPHDRRRLRRCATRARSRSFSTAARRLDARPASRRCSPTTASSPAEEGLREALTSTGNGYFCTARHRRVGGRRRRPLPGHLRPRRLQPRDHDHGRPPGAQRGPGQPAQLARAQAAHRGRGGDPARQRRAALLPARVRHPRRDGATASCASATAPAARRRCAAAAS